MKRRVEVKELAADPVTESFLWYESQRNGLGFEFLEEWESVVAYLSEHAECCQKRYKEFRQAMLKRFPYLVVYEFDRETLIIYNVIQRPSSPFREVYKEKIKLPSFSKGVNTIKFSN